MYLSTGFVNKGNRTVKRSTVSLFPFFPRIHRLHLLPFPSRGSRDVSGKGFVIKKSGPPRKEVQVPNEEKEDYGLKAWRGAGFVSLSLFCTQDTFW